MTTNSSEPVIGSTAPDAFGLGRYRDWLTGEIGPRMRFGGDTGVMLWGPMGAFKDSAIINPYLLQSSGQSVVVVDPKGEACAITSPYRRTLGPVYIINPYGVLVDQLPDMKSDGYNPLSMLEPEKPSFSADCGYVADAIKPSEPNASANSKHFDVSANAFIHMAIMKEVLDAKAQGRLPTMTNVRALICLDSGYNQMAKTAYGWPVLARELLSSNIPALANLATQFATWSNEKDSIASDARRSTKELDDPEIAADMNSPGFEFDEAKRRPCTIYIVVPPLQLVRQASYLRMVVDRAIRAVLRERAISEPRVVFLLNEMFALGRLEVFSQVWSLARGYGVQMVSVWQDMSQIEQVWGDKQARTMIAAAGLLSSFRAGSMETAEWLSRRCGDTTAVLAGLNQGTQQNGAGMGNSSGLSWGQVKVRAVTPHEMFNLADGQMVHFVAGMADFISGYAPPYWKIQQCAERARANPYYQPRRAA